MAFSMKYAPLFKADILHQYFLNKGDAGFNSMTEDEKAQQLRTFNIHSALSISPTHETQLKITGYKLVFKKVNTGFILLTKVDEADSRIPFIDLEDDLSFTFLIQIKEPIFFNYTDLDMGDTGKLFYLSNRRLSTETMSFPLINKAGGNNHVDSSFVLTDISAGVERKLLEVEEKKNLLGIIRIFMKADLSSLNVTAIQGKISDPFVAFQLVLKNRKTLWRYFFDKNQHVTGADDVKKENGNSKILITKAEQPLTQSGFVSIVLGGKELPNPSARMVKPGISNKYYSEIYM